MRVFVAAPGQRLSVSFSYGDYDALTARVPTMLGDARVA